MVSLGGHVLTGAPQTFADGTTGTLTASFSYNATTGAGVISYSYTLIDNTLVDPSSSSSFAVVVTDADGDSAPAGNLVIAIIDDVPDGGRPTPDATAVGQFTAETGNVITAVGDDLAGERGALTFWAPTWAVVFEALLRGANHQCQSGRSDDAGWRDPG